MKFNDSQAVVCLALFILVLGGLGALHGAPLAHADTSLIYTVDATTAVGGVYARYAPHTSATNRTIGYGVYPGQTVQLLCGVTDGDPVGPYNNHTWHFVGDLSNPGEGNFWLNDHYIVSPNVANQLAPRESKCKNESSNPMEVEPWDIPTTSVHHYVDYVVWVRVSEGESLHVYMTKFGYSFARFNPSNAFNEVMEDAHMGYSPTMHDQFVCHAELAPPNKPSWNLDTWRPDPGTLGTIKDRCNPQTPNGGW